MEAVTNFIKNYIEDEYQAHISFVSERNQEKQIADANKHRSYFNPKMLNPPGFFRKGEINEEWFGRQKKTTEIYKRTLFQIKEYDNEIYGKIYRCYLSDSNYNDKEYQQCIFIAEIKGNLKIFSIYILDSDDEIKTSLKDWVKVGGEEIKKLGKPSNIVKFEPPVDNEAHIEEYEKE